MEFQKTFLSLYFLLQGTLFLSQTHRIGASHFGNQTDQLSLLEFKSRLATNELLNMWNKSVPLCQWPGVTCGHKHHRVTALDLSGLNLVGPISPHIGNLSFLKRFDLSVNKLYGEIPHETGRLSRLRILNLSRNALEGAIPMNLSYCTELIFLGLGRNNLKGDIPMAIGSLKKLILLNFQSNSLTGEIPQALGNLSSLRKFWVPENHLRGNIPNELSKLTNLADFVISVNKISGIFPPSLLNLSSLVNIATAENLIIGSLPPDIGFRLPNLSFLAIGGNLFTGNIPKSLANASGLSLIDISANAFVGPVPHSLGSLSNLQGFSIGQNQVGGNPTLDLSFLEPLSNCTNLKLLGFYDNNMIGKLPNSIANLSIQLESLFMGGNRISGVIPEAMGNLFNLYLLAMEDNLLSGSIPSALGRLKKLQGLNLEANQLSGEIPTSLGDISMLSELLLSFNKLEGNIPDSIHNLKGLQLLKLANNNFSGLIPPQVLEMASLSDGLDLSNNRLSGPLPVEIGNLISINALDISKNNLSGEIPNAIANCLVLEYLNLSENSFRGTIPYALTNLKSIISLNLSRNNLSGKIPDGIENLTYLQYIDFSFNDLEGEVPTRGVFGNVSSISLAGNSKLCGGIPELKLPPCPNTKAHKNHNLTIVLVIVVVFVIAIVLFGILYWKRKKMKVVVASMAKDKLMRISYWELHRATNEFSSENLIGSGSFGTVYKGKLDQRDDKIVAVKVLNLQNSRASKSFVAECKILRNVRHRNLIKIMTYCSSIDARRDEFKALVYEYMPNGNLDIWLHQGEESISTTLDLLQRLNIAIDVASALHYLHNSCEPPIVHCDLKPSNILLDAEMCAHVSDFGLARFLPKTNGIVSEVSSMGLKGAIGYAAPEYGTGGEISTHGDVYAYGILLLEMITARRPTDDTFEDGFNLHTYVQTALPDQVLEIIDPVLHNEQQEAQGESERRESQIVEINEQRDNTKSTSHGEFEKKNIIAILRVALACSEESPAHRIDMNYVLRELHNVKNVIIAYKDRFSPSLSYNMTPWDGGLVLSLADC